MAALPDPIWPVVALALITAVDGALCIKPISFVAACFEAVNWPRRYWWIMPPIKFAAAAGLIAGVWIPYVGALACGALILYFLVAISMHIAARDLGRNLYLNAAGMFVICVATGLFGFVL